MYIGEIARNFEARVNEHNNVNKQPEHAKHIKLNLDHVFSWEVLTTTQSWLKRRIIEAFYIASFHPEYNKQVQSI